MKIRNAFGTRFRGSQGKSIIASSWRGVDYIKAYARPRDPRTEAQRAWRSRFAEAVGAWRSVPEAVKETYRRRAGRGLSGYNLFLSEYLTAGRSEAPSLPPPATPAGKAFAFVPVRLPMKRDLMDILACPVCKGELALAVEKEEKEILEGTLHCGHCDHTYEIRDGIPNLLPPDFA